MGFVLKYIPIVIIVILSVMLVYEKVNNNQLTQSPAATPEVISPTASPTTAPTDTPTPKATSTPVPTPRPMVKIDLYDGQYYCFQDTVNQLSSLSNEIKKLKIPPAICKLSIPTQSAAESCRIQSEVQRKLLDEKIAEYSKMKTSVCP